MKRITRNRILVGIIFLGLLNFMAYTFFYWYFQGDARNGGIRFTSTPASGTAPAADDAAPGPSYILRGHFLRTRAGLESAAVSRRVWLYSFVHSITIWPTIGAILVSMFILARPHIIATLKSDMLFSGRTAVNTCILLVVLVTLAATVVFVVDLVQALDAVARGQDYGI